MRQISAHWGPFIHTRRNPPNARLAEEMRLRATQTYTATVQDSTLREEMRALEPAHEDAKPRTLKIKPMGWLSQIRATDDDESWPLDLWQSFFCSTIGLPLPIVAAQPSTRCGCGRWYLDQYGDHAKTCCNEALTHGAARCTHAGMNWSTSAA